MRKFLVLAAALAAAVFVVPASAGAGVRPHGVGLLDCNGRSPIQKSVRVSLACSDPRSIYDGKSVHFFDNGQYIGHDEPIIRFLSKRHGSGNDITWLERLPRDPKALPTVAQPGQRRDALVRALDRAVVLDGALQRAVLPAQPVQAAQRLERAEASADVRQGRRRQLVPRDAVLRAGVRAVRRQRVVRQHALVRVASHQRPGVLGRVRDLQQQLHRADELRVHPDERRARPARRARSSQTPRRSRPTRTPS